MAIEPPPDLHSTVEQSLTLHRPILHHLNADSSWLVQIPRPASAPRAADGRRYFNILIDPWLAGAQSDVASWFSRQWHAEASAYGSVEAVEELVRDTEAAARAITMKHRQEDEGVEKEGQALAAGSSVIDAVAISHEFTDHCHKATLKQLHADVPVFAVREAAKLIARWKHFRTVVTVPVFGASTSSSSSGKNTALDWRSTSLAPLPSWLGISRLVQTDDVLNYHAALLITFPQTSSSAPQTPEHERQRSDSAVSSPEDEAAAAEAILYTPHGLHSVDLAVVAQATPRITTLALLHGLHNIRVGTAAGRTALQSNLGAHNGLAAQRVLQARYWIGTHDEVKKGGGLVGRFLQREVLGVKEAVERERERKRKEGEVDEGLEAMEGVNWLELRNGERRVLV